MRKEFTKSTRLQAFERSQGRCECCGIIIVGAPEYDHIVPDCVGGLNDLSNCMVMSLKCHRRKTIEIDIPQITKSTRILEKRLGLRGKSQRGFKGSRKFSGEVNFK